MQKKFIFHDKQINYTVQGEDKTIVFLHGFLESLRMWDDFAEVFSKNFRVICIDLPGFGETDTFSDVHTMDFMARTIKEVLDHEKINKCLLIGHSLGGFLTVEFYAHYPQYLEGMVILHANADADNPEQRLKRDEAIESVKQDKNVFAQKFITSLFAPENRGKYQDVIEGYIKDAEQASLDSVIAAIIGMRDRKSRIDVLAGMQVPLLYILGKQDPRNPFAKTLAQASLPGVSEILVLGDVAHMGQIEARDITLQAVYAFVLKTFGLTL